VPVLSMPADTTLGDTLSNLGTTLSSALNPMNQIRAQDMYAQMQQRQWEIQKQQRLDAANQNAATVYHNTNPHNLSPADLEVATSQIRNGQFNPQQTMDALVASSNYVSRKAAADVYAANNPNMPPDQLASDQADLISGRKNASELANDRANAAQNANKAGALIKATTAAQGAVTGPNAALAAAAAASGQEPDAAKLIAQGTAAQAPIITGSLDDPNVQKQIDDRKLMLTVAGAAPPAGAPVSAGLAAPQAVADITQKNLTTQAAPRAPSEVVPQVAPTNVLTGAPAAPIAPGAPQAPSTFNQPPRGPDTAATAATTGAEAGSKFAAEARVKDLKDDMDAMDSSQTLLRDIGLLRQAADALPNDTPMNQAQSAFVNRFFGEFGVTATEGQSARETFENIAKQMIGPSRRDVGVTRVAGPELGLFDKLLPNAFQDRASLTKSLDNIETKARLGLQTGKLALGVIAKSADGTISPQDYANYRTAKEALNAPPTETMAPGSTPPRSATELPGSHATPQLPQRYRIENGQRVPIPSSGG
jgi:hypothetical protein